MSSYEGSGFFLSELFFKFPIISSSGTEFFLYINSTYVYHLAFSRNSVHLLGVLDLFRALMVMLI